MTVFELLSSVLGTHTKYKPNYDTCMHDSAHQRSQGVMRSMLAAQAEPLSALSRKCCSSRHWSSAGHTGPSGSGV